MTFIVDPAIRLLFAAAILYFCYGVYKFIKNSDSDSGRAEGRDHILWSTVGLFIMVSVWGIMEFIQNSLAR
jgi:hypothetical protein